MQTFTGEDIIAIAVRHTNGRVNYFLTLGKFYWQADLEEIAQRVLSGCRGFALDGEPESAHVCYSLLDASREPYFYEHFFALCQLRLPDYRHGAREICDRQARQIHDEILEGHHLLFCGSRKGRQ